MASTSVRMILNWSVPCDESQPSVSALQALMLARRTEPGCAGCWLFTDANSLSEVTIRYIEEWTSEEHLSVQLRSGRLAALAELMERASEMPNVKFVLPQSIRGMDYADEVLSSAG